MPTGVSRAIGSRRRVALCTAALAAGAIAFGTGAAPTADAIGRLFRTGPEPTVAYVTQAGTSLPSVWVVAADGTGKQRLGPGYSPLINGQQVAVSLFGAGAGETGPALAIYRIGAAEPPLTYFDLAHETATPLAWTRDLRYLAVEVQSTAVSHGAQRSSLAIVDLGLKTVKVIAGRQIFGASFAPNGSDEIVYGRAASLSLNARVNLYRSRPDGSQTVALTRDGRSLFPVWGNQGIAYDRERLRKNDAPVYQIWLRQPTGSAARRLTNVRVRSLVSGLVPIGFSTNGLNLLAQFEGQDTSEAWTVRVPSGRTHRLSQRGGRVLAAAGISGDGKTVLLDEGGFESPASQGRVVTRPFRGGASKVLVAHGSQASWED